MMKTCVVLNGDVINVGEWDYQKQTVVVTPAEFDEEGYIIEEAVYEEVAMNPQPEGATIEERDFKYSEEHGWRETGWVPPLSELEKLQQENRLLKAQNQALAERTDFHEDVLTEIIHAINP